MGDEKEPRRLQVITNSELGSFANCTQMHGFSYVDLLRPRLEAPYFATGGAYHKGTYTVIRDAFALRAKIADHDQRLRVAVTNGLAAAGAAHVAYENRIRASDAGPQIIAERLREAREALPLILDMVARHIEATESDFVDLLPVALERRFEVPVPAVDGGARTVVRHRGVVDVVWYDREQGDLIVEDHKSSVIGADAFVRKLEHDPQMTGYVRAVEHELRAGTLIEIAALRALGWTEAEIAEFLERWKRKELRVGRIRYNVVRKALPADPQVLKRGTISVDKGINTTPAKYRAALDAQERICLACAGTGYTTEAPEGTEATPDTWTRKGCKVCETTGRGQPVTQKQLDLLAELRAKPDPFFARLEVWRGPSELERWRRETLAQATRIRETERDPLLRTRNLYHCTRPGGRCDYMAICSVTHAAAEAPRELVESFRIADDKHEEWTEADPAAAEEAPRYRDDHAFSWEG